MSRERVKRSLCPSANDGPASQPTGEAVIPTINYGSRGSLCCTVLETDPKTGSDNDKLKLELAIELFLEVDDYMQHVYVTIFL